MKISLCDSAPRRGFTLLELLVTIAIVASLAALLVPAASNMKEGANQSKCLGNLRQLASAIQLYAAENDNRFPIYPAAAAPDPPVSGAWWHQRVDVYVDSKFSDGNPSKAFICPSDKTPYSNLISYGMNRNLAGKRFAGVSNRLILLVESANISLLGNADITNLKYNHKGGKSIHALLADGSVHAVSSVPGIKNATADPQSWIP